MMGRFFPYYPLVDAAPIFAGRVIQPPYIPARDHLYVAEDRMDVERVQRHKKSAVIQ
jgi:hypothetical protein